MPDQPMINNYETNIYESLRGTAPVEVSLLLANLRDSIWILGIPSCIFGIADRGVAALSDGYFSPIEILHLLTVSFLFMSWLFLKPEKSVTINNAIEPYQPDVIPCQEGSFFHARLLELQHHHLISQAYILPFPYLCQIYHLLNLKHLESVHSFSLNNLRVISVSQFQPTTEGGMIRFQTVLDSSVNALRIWRQPIVEVELTLHTPYTVELSIPVYNGKRMTVIFTALPINENEHRLLIDIYSDLKWPKPVLQAILHFASCLTLFEDLPYLQKLAERKIDRLLNANRTSNHETMRLFKRFVDLYGSNVKTSKLLEASATDAQITNVG